MYLINLIHSTVTFNAHFFMPICSNMAFNTSASKGSHGPMEDVTLLVQS